MSEKFEETSESSQDLLKQPQELEKLARKVESLEKQVLKDRILNDLKTMGVDAGNKHNMAISDYNLVLLGNITECVFLGAAKVGNTGLSNMCSLMRELGVDENFLAVTLEDLSKLEYIYRPGNKRELAITASGLERYEFLVEKLRKIERDDESA